MLIKKAVDFIGGYNPKEAKEQKDEIEALMREVDVENENEYREAGLPYYKFNV